MREIKFRGKRLDNGEWVVGYYVAHRTRVGSDQLRHLIICNEEMSQQHPVDPQTVGQFIGLLDKNGKEIYGGDITNRGIVEWCECLNWDTGGSTHPGFYFKDKYDNGERGALSYHDGFDKDIEVIGNIYESNKEGKR